MGSMLQSAVASAQRIFEFLDADEEERDNQDAPRLAELTAANGGVKGHVEFDHVQFAYTADKPLIRDLSLEAQPGQTIAIVGPTGAGKTTLVNLLMRFYEINGGHIRLDGVDTKQLIRQDLRSHFGMVLQDTWLFEGTIRENLFTVCMMRLPAQKSVYLRLLALHMLMSLSVAYLRVTILF